MNLTNDEKYEPQNIDQLIGKQDIAKNIVFWLDKFKQNAKKYRVPMKERKQKRRRKTKIVSETSENENSDEESVNENETEENKSEYINNYKGAKKVNNTNKNEYSSLLIIGDHGIGKTTMINVLLKQHNYNIQYIDLSKITSKKDIEQHIISNLKTNDISNKLNNKYKQKVIVIDEIELANTTSQKEFVIQLLKENSLAWNYPIILISCGKYNTFLTNVKKYTYVINVPLPQYSNMLELIADICNIENIGIDDEKTAKIIIEHAQSDYRRLVIIMKELLSNKKDIIEIDDVKKYMKISETKNRDVDIFKSTLMILSKQTEINDGLRLYDVDKIIMPLMIQENYIEHIINNHNKGFLGFDVALNIANSFSLGDIIEEHIYGEQAWDLQYIHAFISFIYTAYKLYNEKMRTAFIKLSYPNDRNRKSGRGVNKKNIVKSNLYFNNFGIKDYIYLSGMIRQMIDNKDYKGCGKILHDYGMTTTNIDTILKIDKTNEIKSLIVGKTKKMITMELNKYKNDKN